MNYLYTHTDDWEEIFWRDFALFGEENSHLLCGGHSGPGNGGTIMRKLIRICLVVGVFIGCFNQSVALTFGSFEYEINNGEVTITDCQTDITEAVIPAEIGGLPVTAIGFGVFMDCTSLTSVEIPNTVTSIGNHAMACCA